MVRMWVISIKRVREAGKQEDREIVAATAAATKQDRI